MADGEVWKDKISSRRRPIQVGNTGDRHTGEDWTNGRLAGNAAVSDGAGVLQGREEEEVGIVGESDIGLVHLIVEFGFEDSQFNDRRRINGTTVR